VGARRGRGGDLTAAPLGGTIRGVDLPFAELGRFIVDVGAGKIVEKALEPVLEPTWRLLKAVLLPLWDPAFSAVRLNLQEHIDRERAKREDFVERLEQSLQRGEAAALVALFVREAAQATTKERMRMLAAAAAGVFTPDLNSETRSRVARAIAQVEPSDVVELRNMDAAERVPGMQPAPRITLEREPLVRSGCVSDMSMFVSVGHQISVTPLGRALLHALEAWSPT
jgi:hypothetical protein